MGSRTRTLLEIIVPVVFAFLCTTISPVDGCAKTIQYEYDNLNRLITIRHDDGGAVVHSYDALGNRHTKSSSSTTNANTPPSTPSDFLPSDGSLGLPSFDLTLSWSGSDPDLEDIVRYDVYIGTTDTPTLYKSGLSEATIALPPLKPATQYYWKIVAKDNYNSTSEGPMLSFTTGNSEPTVPHVSFPQNNTIISPEGAPFISWSPSTDSDPMDTVIYDIYLGTSETPPLYRNDYQYNSIQFGELLPATTYYWKVVAKDKFGAISETPIQSFTTLGFDHLLYSTTISEDTVLENDKGPYIVKGTLTIPLGVTLTIPAGTVIKFDADSSLAVYGIVKALGTETNKVILTSINNDTVASDTNNNGELTVPAPGDWYGIRFYNNTDDATSTLEHCIVEYAGCGNYGAIQTQDASPTIKDTIVRFSSTYGVYVYSGNPKLLGNTVHNNSYYGIYVRSGSPEIRNSVIKDNTSGGIHLAGGSSIVSDNTLEGPTSLIYISDGTSNISGNTFEGPTPLTIQANALGSSSIAADNVIDTAAYIIIPGGTITKDATWPALQLPYRITGHITILGTDGEDGITTLTLQPGVKLLFGGMYYIAVGGYSGNPGALIAKGTAELPITFTSADTPAPGDWLGILFNPTTDDATSTLEHCIVEYAGCGNYGAIQTQDASPTIKDTIVRFSSTYGVHVYSGNPKLLGNTIHNNSYYGIYVRSGSPEIRNSVIKDNTSGGIHLAGGSSIVSDNTLEGSTSLIYISDGTSNISGNTFEGPTPLTIQANALGSSSIAADNVIDTAAYIIIPGGTITKDATWPALQLPYRITGHITILGTDGEDGITTLTLQPGVKLLFGGMYYIAVGGYSGNPGALIAKGTAELPITFTSADTPAPGDWLGILFNPTTDDATSTLEHCIVEYAGYSNYGAIQTQNASPTIKDTIVRFSSTYGVHVYSGNPYLVNCSITDNGSYGIYVRSGSPEIRNSVIKDNTSGGIHLAGGSSIVSDNTLEGSTSLIYISDGTSNISGNTFEGPTPLTIQANALGSSSIAADNVIDTAAYIIIPGGTITKDATWPALQLPYRITGHITILGTDGEDGITTLTLQPGVKLLFGGMYYIAVGGYSGNPGALIAKGTAELPITFTSADTPAPGDWLGILFNPTTDDATSTLEHCIVEYAGCGNYGAIQTQDASPTIKDTIVRFSSTYGVYVYSGNPKLLGNTVHNNSYYGIYVRSGSPEIRNSVIKDNTSGGIHLAGGSSIVSDNTLEGPTSLIYISDGTSNISGNTFEGPTPLTIQANALGSSSIAADNVIDTAAYIIIPGGTITKDATWPALQLPYRITGHITILGTDGEDGITTLTLQPGVKLLFGGMYYIAVGGYSGNPGALIAKGTAELPITFTSADTPAPGDWLGILFNPTTDDATSTLEHCIVEYAGCGNYGAIQTQDASPTIKDTIVRFSSTYGVYVYSGNPKLLGNTIHNNSYYGIYVRSGSPEIRNSVIKDNTSGGIHLAGGSSIVSDNTLEGSTSLIYISDGTSNISGNTFEGPTPLTIQANALGSSSIAADNVIDTAAYIIIPGGTITKDATWPALQLPYRITGHITILGTDGEDGITTLTLQPGVKLLFGGMYYIAVGGYSGNPGALIAKGTAELPITFTSADTPAPGDWFGILFNNTTDDATSTLEHCIVEYAGYGNYGAIQTQNASPTIKDTIVRFSSTYGVYVYSGNPYLANCSITDNGSYGILNNSSTTIISAENIWWGDLNGPKDISDDVATGGLYNPDSLGQSVSNFVDYSPWLATDINKDSDGDGIKDITETETYGSNPHKMDSDTDGINDSWELIYWGANWSQDVDGDGIINLLDFDSDDDSYRDGLEIANGFDPADSSSKPLSILYEDAENDNVLGWQVYDNEPIGAIINNVFDSDMNNKVIELSGDGLLNVCLFRQICG